MQDMFKYKVKKMKFRFIGLIVIWLLSGCYASRGIPLFNNYGMFGFGNSVTVNKGDTLYSISRRYNVEMKDLISANHLRSPYVLKVGQHLQLPKTNYHTVGKGDTLYSIAKKYNTDVTTLSRANHIQSPQSLALGQNLLIPSGQTQYASNVTKSTVKSSSSNVKSAKKTATNSKTSAKTAKKQPTKVANAGKTTKSAPSRNVSKSRKTKFAWPVRGTVISKFGAAGKGINNDGINIKAAKGTAVKAADSGVVAYSGSELKGYGNLILIKHADGWITAYAHNDKLFVKKGQKVVKGEKIASVGTTGGVSNAQLHFETRAGKNAVNPLNHLP